MSKRDIKWVAVDIPPGQTPLELSIVFGQGLAFHNIAAQDYFIRLFIDEQAGADPCKDRKPVVGAYVKRNGGYAHLIPDENRKAQCTFDIVKVADAGRLARRRKASKGPRGGTHKITISSS